MSAPSLLVEPPQGYWRREASHYPQPLSPMTRSAMLDEMNGAFRRMFEATGALLDGIEFREIGGWVYNRQVPLGGKDRNAPPKWLMWLAVRTAPALRARVRTNVRAIREDLTFQWVERWYQEWKPGQEASIARLRAVDLARLDDDSFLEHIEAVRVFTNNSIDIHFRLGAVMLPIVELVFACEELLGWDERRALALLAGLSTASTEPAKALGELARMAADRPGVAAIVSHAGPGSAARLATADPEFAAAFDTYQHSFGLRALRYELAEPTLAEVPDLTVALIRDQVARGYDHTADAEAAAAKRVNLAGEARAALAGRSESDRQRFERLLSRAERVYPIREDNEFTTVSVPLAIARIAVLEAGRRMLERGQIEAQADVFFLEWPEMVAHLRDGVPAQALVAQRKAEQEWTIAHPGPASYGTPPGPPPSFDVLPPDTAFSMKAVFWMTDHIFEEDRSGQRQPAGATTIRGVGAAPGRYTGPARVILGEDDFDKIEAGDVLVCPITSPVWSIIFPSVGALVTDTGGILSHPAIIAREYGVPAVVATGNATSLLKDGQIVTVDGGQGLVELAAG